MGDLCHSQLQFENAVWSILSVGVCAYEVIAFVKSGIDAKQKFGFSTFSLGHSETNEVRSQQQTFINIEKRKYVIYC